jgi:hypothetical protein
MYKNLLLQIMPNIEILEAKPRADTGKPTGRPMDNQWTAQDRLGKGSIGEDIIPPLEEKVEVIKKDSYDYEAIRTKYPHARK